MTTKEDTKEEDITYTPCKNVYDYAFGDGQKNYGDATIIEDDDAYYIVMSRDIKDRMTEDDLWTESQQNTVISQEYSDAFEDMLDGWRRTTAQSSVMMRSRSIWTAAVRVHNRRLDRIMRKPDWKQSGFLRCLG